MRYFNTFGPVNQTEHYVVSRRELITDLVTQIERGPYFTLYAPRQMGKTTLVRHLVTELLDKPDYLPVILSFQRFESWSVTRFLHKIGMEISQQINSRTTAHQNALKIQSIAAPTTIENLWDFFENLASVAPDIKVVLVIDEFDATPQEALSPLLQTWREFYILHPPPRVLHSVILIGIQNIATLNLGRSSPFNIARQIQLPSFTLAQVQALFEQYTVETGQTFATGVREEIHALTGGQPFLVNRLAAILTEEIATERNRPIDHANLQRALSKLVRERNYNYETLVRHAQSYQEPTLRILFGAHLKFTLNTPMVHALSMYGIIKENKQGFCEIANPIYKRILNDYFQPLESDLQASILVNSYDLRVHVVGDELQMEQLLSQFREFIERRGREAFKVTPMPQEATGQYLLMAYLDLLVRQVGGDLFTEVNSGSGRLDLIVVYHGHRYIIETKIWRGAVEFEKGLEQLEDYLDSESQTVGYYVVFHARPRVYGKLTFEQLEWVEQRERAKIYTYLVRLGAVFEEE
ncbi:MAG TPA: hypothetical protein ENG03_00800 [Thioploca sp.]|nr:hypothetical protein [Thioploca sp.]